MNQNMVTVRYLFLVHLQAGLINDMSKIPRLPGDGAQADPDANHELPNKSEPCKRESRKSLHDMECGKY